MRIALFHNLPSGGAKRHTLEQLRELKHRGYSVVEYAPFSCENDFCSFTQFVDGQNYFKSDAVFPVQKRIPFITPYLNTLLGIRLLKTTRRLNQVIAKEINKQDFDVIFVKDCQIMPSPYVLRYLSGFSIFQCHHVQRTQIHKKDRNYKNQKFKDRLKAVYYSPAEIAFALYFLREERTNIDSATLVLSNSKYSCNKLRQDYGVKPQLLYPGININIFRPITSVEENYVLCVGSLHKMKGYQFLIKAIAALPENKRPMFIIIANSTVTSEEMAVKELANKLHVKVKIEKIFDDERLVNIYNRAKVFIYGPIQEALGMAPLEAMACGTPVVAVGEGGVQETILDGETGFLVERDQKAFAERLDTLLTDEKLRRSMGQAGIDYVRREWSWTCAVDRLEEYFQAVFHPAPKSHIR
jgi:glycosyltransferase involved in cell wall biosynthesis